MPTQLRTRTRARPASRTTQPTRSGSFAAAKTIEISRREPAVDARATDKLPIQATSLELSRFLGKQNPHRDGRDSLRIATLLGIQRSSGNYAVQKLLRRLDPALGETTLQANGISDSGNGLQSLATARNGKPLNSSTAVQRLSWSDLNPIEAAKNLAAKAWDGIKSLGSSAWETAKEAGSEIWNSVKETGGLVWQGLTDGASAAWETVKQAGSKAWDTARSLGGKAWTLVSALGGRAWNWAKNMGSRAWEGAKSLGGRAWNWAKGFGSNLWNRAKSLGSSLWNTAKRWGSSAWNAAKSGIAKAWGGIKALGAKVWKSVKGAADRLWTGAKNLGSKAWSLGKTIADNLSIENLCKAIAWVTKKVYDFLAPYVRRAWNWVKEQGAKLWELAKKWGSKLWSDVKSAVTKVKAFAKRALSKAFNAVKNLASRAWKTAKQLGSKLLNGAKLLGSKAWNFAKSVGTKAWNGAKALAGKVWNFAKLWGGKAIDAAKRLGAAAWERAKALGAKIWDKAKGAASKLLGLADKLTGGLASKVAGLANKILGKAAGLLSWVFNKARDLADRALDTAKRWASKALDTAKEWGQKLWDGAKHAASKAWDIAKSFAAKAWSTAKSLASNAWEAAKRLGRKAIETAKTLASKAWSAAKNLASKAWNAAKTLAGKAWSTLKSWAGTAWTAIKGAASKVWGGIKWFGGKAWAAAKSVGSKALDLAKKIGLDKAWDFVKRKGSEALAWASKAWTALKKRLGPVIDVVKKVGEYVGKAALLLNPATWPLVGIWVGCKTLACLMPKLMEKGSTSQKATDLATDLTPFVSTVKDGCGCLTGENIVTGEEIGGGERAVRCTVAVIDIAGYVAGFFSEGAATVGEQAAKGAIRAWLERLLKIGGKELAEKGSEAIVKQFAKMGEKELAEALAKMGEKELKELAEQAAKSGEKDLAEKLEKELAERAAKDAAVGEAKDQIRHAVCGFCFPAGTKVLTPQGYTNIEELAPGDFVLAQDEKRQASPVYRRVLQTFQNVTDTLVQITIGKQQIKTTLGHVWWISGRGWILAKDIKVGDLAVTSLNELARVEAVRYLSEFAATYNLQVEEYPTYFVSGDAGQPGIWVHNQSVGLRVLRPDQVYQLIIPQIVITAREAIRQVVGNALQASGSYSTELKGLYSFLRGGGGAGFQGVTKEAIDRLEIVLKNVEQKGGGVVAAVDLERIGAKRIFDLSDPELLKLWVKEYPENEKMFRRLASEGVVAVRGKIPANAVQSLVNIPAGLSEAGKRQILEELAKPCKK